MRLVRSEGFVSFFRPELKASFSAQKLGKPKSAIGNNEPNISPLFSFPPNRFPFMAMKENLLFIFHGQKLRNRPYMAVQRNKRIFGAAKPTTFLASSSFQKVFSYNPRTLQQEIKLSHFVRCKGHEIMCCTKREKKEFLSFRVT